MKSALLLLSLSVIIMATAAVDIIPKALKDCYNKEMTTESKPNCLQSVLEDTPYNPLQLVDQNALDWLDDLVRKLVDRLTRSNNRRYYGNNRYNGYKSTIATPTDNRRVRKEIRTLTDPERDDFLAAVLALKNDTVSKIYG